MDACEATNILISKIKTLDPENAPKIMGYILLQGPSDHDLARLASSPETLLRNVVFKAKTQLALSSNILSASLSNPSSPSPLNPISRPTNPFSQASPRVAGDGSFVDFSKNPSPYSWPLPRLPNGSAIGGPKSSPFLSYESIRSGSVVVPPFLDNGDGDCSNSGGELLDEHQLDEYLSFLDDPSSMNEEEMDKGPQWGGFLGSVGDSHLHRRRFSESDTCLVGEDGGFGMECGPCAYFARGFCKNGDNCKFIHGGFGGDDVFEGGGGGGLLVGSPRETEGLYLQQHEEIMRMKAAQQQQRQRLAYDKYMNFLLQQRDDPHRLGTAATMIGDGFHNFGRFHNERYDLYAMGIMDKSNSAARQIYLTFPADSTFKDEDVANYFSTFGQVQDVRIPYQQKRMFGFVTFVHRETVKLILARGNPHFICDSRVLVKPYKEKGKLANERQHHLHQQLLERGNFSPCLSPSGLHPRELYDLHLDTRMLQDAQEMMLRRKLEEHAELQQAIELQGRRLVNLQLPDLRPDYAHHHQRSLSVGAPISLQNNVFPGSNHKIHEVSQDDGSSTAVAISPSFAADQNLEREANPDCIQKGNIACCEAYKSESEGCEVKECCGTKMKHVLPDNLFGSPTKSSGIQQPNFSADLVEVGESSQFPSIPSSITKDSATANSASDVTSN